MLVEIARIVRGGARFTDRKSAEHLIEAAMARVAAG